jgi:microcin C transport system permease protein
LVDDAVEDRKLADFLPLSAPIERAVRLRLDNQSAEAVEEKVSLKSGELALLSLSAYAPRSSAPKTVRLTLRTLEDESAGSNRVVIHEDGSIEAHWAGWRSWSEPNRKRVGEWVATARQGALDDQEVEEAGTRYSLRFEPLKVAYPFGPTPGHPLGLDHSGRDVLVRILYATRIGLAFAFLLTLSSTIIGILLGAIQGYFAGWVDLAGQRFIEIWGSLPFLYVVILLSSIFGRSFLLLLVVYTAFNWIGVDAYMRAEYLRLRKMPFVESAVCLGASTPTILFRHILPNALTPIITFFPFLLVGAIGSINALDYLGYGMPAGTPSFGDLLGQAQDHRQAWWLTLYPAVSLFSLMLFGVFIGDGLRAAFDPRSKSRME